MKKTAKRKKVDNRGGKGGGGNGKRKKIMIEVLVTKLMPVVRLMADGTDCAAPIVPTVQTYWCFFKLSFLLILHLNGLC